MSGPLKAAWVLTAFVVVAGVVLWVTTGRAVFAVFLVLGLITAVGAWFTGRAESRKGTP
jgi:dolichol kinase